MFNKSFPKIFLYCISITSACIADEVSAMNLSHPETSQVQTASSKVASREFNSYRHNCLGINGFEYWKNSIQPYTENEFLENTKKNKGIPYKFEDPKIISFESFLKLISLTSLFYGIWDESDRSKALSILKQMTDLFNSKEVFPPSSKYLNILQKIISCFRYYRQGTEYLGA